MSDPIIIPGRDPAERRMRKRARIKSDGARVGGVRCARSVVAGPAPVRSSRDADTLPTGAIVEWSGGCWRMVYVNGDATVRRLVRRAMARAGVDAYPMDEFGAFRCYGSAAALDRVCTLLAVTGWHDDAPARITQTAMMQWTPRNGVDADPRRPMPTPPEFRRTVRPDHTDSNLRGPSRLVNSADGRVASPMPAVRPVVVKSSVGGSGPPSMPAVGKLQRTARGWLASVRAEHTRNIKPPAPVSAPPADYSRLSHADPDLPLRVRHRLRHPLPTPIPAVRQSDTPPDAISRTDAVWVRVTSAD